MGRVLDRARVWAVRRWLHLVPLAELENSVMRLQVNKSFEGLSSTFITTYNTYSNLTPKDHTKQPNKKGRK